MLLLPAYADDGGRVEASTIPRVRATDYVTRLALAHGAAWSPTFRALLVRLQRSDVIVHVVRRPPGPGTPGVTQFVASTPHARYLRITIGAAGVTDEVVALLGHELQHAVETAESPEVTDLESYHALYGAIGHASCDAPAWCFDTLRAIVAGRRILAELKGRRDATGRARRTGRPRADARASHRCHDDVTSRP